MISSIQEAVLAANLRLAASGLVHLTWGNVSGLDRDRGVFYIKPSGIDYAKLQVTDLVGIRVADGAVIDGHLRPSSDTPTHLALYRAWANHGVAGICHTHSVRATAFAQAGCELPCYGTTHADHFFGPVPVCRDLTAAEVADDYEGRTGAAIVSHFRHHHLSPVAMPAVLQAYHAPFTWGPHADKAVENAIALETCADMALHTLALNPTRPPLPSHLLEKHHLRKHGPDAYYGQTKEPTGS